MKRLQTAWLAGWLACGCLVPGLARALDLAGVLREVAAASPTLEARRAMVEAAERRVAAAGAWQSPMMELSAVNVPVGKGFDDDDMTMRMVGASQRVPLFGSNGLNRRSAREAVAAESAVAEMARYELYGAAWEAYADAFYAGELARRAEDHRGVVDRLVESARVRYQSGNGRLEDLLRAEAERARTLIDVAAFGGEERAAQARLQALRGRAPEGGADSLAPLPRFEVPASPDPWLATLSPTHPRLREMEARAGRHHFAALASRRMAWPDLELRGSYGYRGTIRGVPREDMYSASVAFEVPLFGRERPEGAEQDAMARAAQAERRAAELDLRRSVVATHAEAAAAQATVRLLADTVVTAQRRAISATWSAYRAGSTDLWRVFEATHMLYGEELALARAQRDLARAEARLLALVGRGDLLGVELPAAKEGGR